MFKKPLSFSSFGIYVLVSKMSAKNQPFFEDIYYIECLENLDWRFRPKPL